MTREEFFKELERHDWTYAYSDDSNAYKRGRANITRLGIIASQSEELGELFLDYVDWYWNHMTGDGTVEKPTVQS